MNKKIFLSEYQFVDDVVRSFSEKDAKKFCGGVKKYYFCNPISRGVNF